MRQLPIRMVTQSMLAVLIAAVVPIAIAHAADSASPTEVRTSVESLIKQLDAPVLVDRTKAERGLLDLGPEGLKYFPAPELTPSASVRESLKRIRVQLERRAARESANASLVRYSGRATVGEVLSEITRQTRNRVELGGAIRPLVDTTISVDWDSRPFWECLDEICDVLKTRAVFDPQLGVLVLRPREATDRKELAVQHAGPYRLAILAAEVRPIVGNSANQLLRISGKLSLEPRLRPLFLHFAAADLVAMVGDLRLEPWNPAATYELPAGDAGREVPVQFDFLMPNATTPQEVTLVGRISVQLAAATERIVFDQTSQTAGAARRRGGVTVRLREIKFEGPPDGNVQAEIKVNVAYDTGGPAFESHRTWMFHNAVYFENQAGKRFDFTDYDTTLQSNGAVGVDYRWEQLAGPVTQYHFVYEAPTLIVDLPLEIKLDKLPIKLLASKSSPPGKE
ncbi:MAG: hypothetical protein JWP89_5968 [Schlesneria sp.]|nr:hypothetical protein [Schlesneria sp.]